MVRHELAENPSEQFLWVFCQPVTPALDPSANPVCVEEFPETPLHRAVERGSVEFARLPGHIRLTLEPAADASTLKNANRTPFSSISEAQGI